MRKKECVAMLLAGGEGRRLGALTEQMAKPAVHFGGKYRIIDFTLSNCTNSGIDTVGVLTQYQPLVLNSHLGIGSPWDLDRRHGGMTILPPFVRNEGSGWYKGTANAVFQNIDFIDQFDPEYVLVISGDHIYKMNYDLMIQQHREMGADCSIAVIEVEEKEASRFGIISTDDQDRIVQFEEKPKKPKSNLASMGIYVVNWRILKEYLIRDEENELSSNDFGKDIIPAMLRTDKKLYAYPFQGYWKDVGTIESLWEAHMDLLKEEPVFDLNDRVWRIYSQNPNQPPQYIAPQAQVENSLINEGCEVYGRVKRSVLFYGAVVGEGSVIEDSIIMPNVIIGKNVKIRKSILDVGTVVEDGCVVGPSKPSGEIKLIGRNQRIVNDMNTIVKGG